MGSRVDLRDSLLQQRDTLRGQIRALRAEHDDVVDAASLTATDDEHDPEGATIAFERQRIAALLDSSEDRLAAVEAALSRLATGEFGRCDSCGEQISAERLLARPDTTRCIHCA